MQSIRTAVFLLGLAVGGSALAAAPTDAPPGTMGMCKDGSYSSSPEKKGACRGHKGVKDWYGDTAAGTSPGSASADKPAAAASGPKPNGAMAGRTAPTSTVAAAAGGGPGQVWGNSNSKVYHCSGDKYYGKTSKGEYMTEADAKAKGYHADHGKACS